MSVIRGNLVGTTMSPERIAERIGGGGSVEGAVLYTPQTLTAEQMARARQNIDVPAAIEVEHLRDDLNYADYQLGLRVTALENGGGSAESGYKLIETITLEEETNEVRVDFDKKYKSLRVRIVFPSATTADGYVYSKVKVDGYAHFTNLCGGGAGKGAVYVEHIRLASEVSPFVLSSSSTGHGNERAEPMRMSFPIPAQYGFSEKDGFAGILLSTYGISFSAGTVIHIMEG